jgi:hypothetical protein
MPPSLRHRIGYEGAMAIGSNHRCLRYLLAACLVFSVVALRTQVAAQSGQPAMAPPDLTATLAQYRRALEAYTEAQRLYAAASGAYWSSIAEKRKLRNGKRARGEALSINDYVLEQPPIYTGPPKPRNPLKPEAPSRPAYVPVVADFLAAAEREFMFNPRLPQNDGEFKRSYAKVAAAAGLTKDQVVRIYGFEATGNGNYDIEAGLEYNKHARAITTALGYNQLLATNSVEIVAESGSEFVKELRDAAARLPPDQRLVLDNKIEILRRMVTFARSVPDAWDQHEILANTEKGLGVHALNLDLDLGPMLQTQKLLDSVIFARRKGFTAPLTAAELEMMNLTGDGTGFDMVTMPLAWRDKVPTANFFHPSGYADNPVAQRNNVVAKLIAATDARMDEEIKKPGARELAAAYR